MNITSLLSILVALQVGLISFWIIGGFRDQTTKRSGGSSTGNAESTPALRTVRSPKHLASSGEPSSVICPSILMSVWSPQASLVLISYQRISNSPNRLEATIYYRRYALTPSSIGCAHNGD